MTLSSQQFRSALGVAVGGGESPLAAADVVCRGCVDLLAVDGASISVIHHGATQGTSGSRRDLDRRVDELQSTLGHGPCLDCVLPGAPVPAGELAVLALLDLMTADVDGDPTSQGEDGWQQLASLERVEVHQATGMVIAAVGVAAVGVAAVGVAAVGVAAVEAVSVLRAHASSLGLTASELAGVIIERRELLDGGAWPAAARGNGSRS